jgi:ankyrin repeat protein
VTESLPQSRETLFQLLRDLALADGTDPHRLSAAREGIRSGHLGPPSEAFLENGAGRPVPLLVWAAEWGDLEMASLLLDRGAAIDAGAGEDGSALHAAASKGHVALVELLLARGASPLALRRTRESVLRAAHSHGRGAIVPIVRRAAKEAIERSGGGFGGLAALPFDRRYALRTDRGVHDLRRSVEERRQLDVLLVHSDLKTTLRALANLLEAPRREADVASRPVQDAQRLLFVYRLRGIEWTIIPFVFEAASPWNVEHVRELAAPGSSIAPIARAMAGASRSRVVHVKYDEYTIYSEHGGIETRPSDEMDEALRALGVLVPPMRVATDGYHVQLQLFGLEPSDVERVDVVVLQEIGDPDVDRSVQRTAPALVGPPPTLVAPDAPPIVRMPPEPAPEHARSEPPMVHEPPPMVPVPVPKEPPAIVREPPATVARTTPNEAPPLVRGPPPLVTSPPDHVPPDGDDR